MSGATREGLLELMQQAITVEDDAATSGRLLSAPQPDGGPIAARADGTVFVSLTNRERDWCERVARSRKRRDDRAQDRATAEFVARAERATARLLGLAVSVDTDTAPGAFLRVGDVTVEVRAQRDGREWLTGAGGADYAVLALSAEAGAVVVAGYVDRERFELTCRPAGQGGGVGIPAAELRPVVELAARTATEQLAGALWWQADAIRKRWRDDAGRLADDVRARWEVESWRGLLAWYELACSRA